MEFYRDVEARSNHDQRPDAPRSRRLPAWRHRGGMRLRHRRAQGRETTLDGGGHGAPEQHSTASPEVAALQASRSRWDRCSTVSRSTCCTTPPSSAFVRRPASAGRRRSGAPRRPAPTSWSATCRSAARRPRSTTRAPASRPASLRQLHPGVHRLRSAVGGGVRPRRGIPIVGDDIKSQLGATIVHRVLAKLFADRGIELERTYQLNTGGNTDFLNMLNRVAHRDVEETLEDGGGAERACPSAWAREHPHRPERLRPVAEGQQGLLPAHRGTRLRRRADRARASPCPSRTARTPPASRSTRSAAASSPASAASAARFSACPRTS